MPIRAQCFSCGRIYSLPDESAGKRFTCPDCGQVFQVPSAMGSGMGLPSPPQPARGGAARGSTAGAKRCVVCGNDVATIARVKDPFGNYFCQACYDQQARAARQTPEQLLTDPALDPLDLAERVEAAAEPAAEARPVAPTPHVPAAALVGRRGRFLPGRRKGTAVPVAREAPVILPYGAARPRTRSAAAEAFIESALPQLIILAGYLPGLALQVYNAVRVHGPRGLLGVMITQASYLAVGVPLAALGLVLAARLLRFPPPQPVYYVVFCVMAAPNAVINIGWLLARLSHDAAPFWVGLALALPITFLVFSLFNRQGLLYDLVTFFFIILTPISIGLGLLLAVLAVTGLSLDQLPRYF
jgi:hypothetical protein